MAPVIRILVATVAAVFSTDSSLDARRQTGTPRAESADHTVLRPANAPPAPADHFDFGTRTLLEPVEHTFHITNESTDFLDLLTVQLTPPLLAVQGTPRLAPGQRGSLTVRLGQPRQPGPFDGDVVVTFRQSSKATRRFHVSGTLVPSIEVRPAHGIYLAAQRGQRAERSVEIASHEDNPLEILNVEHEGSHFTPVLDVIETGRRYRLTVSVHPDAPTGRTSNTIRLRTSSPTHPVLLVQANTWIKERVYSFPESLDLGTIRTAPVAARPEMNALTSQTLMVYQAGGSDFRVTARTDLPFLRLSLDRSAVGDRYQITVSISPEGLPSGEVNGSIVVTTNDAEFPRLVVPVRGSVKAAPP